MNKQLDVITIGRAGVDLYGTQIGGRLEDMGSFDKYIGGSPTNMACGTARLGLRSALITRVGDEHMGRFIREELLRHGVNVAGVKTDPERLTALVILGIRDEERFPLIFYRENCADMALCEDDIDEGFIASAGSVVATGTHLSHPRTEAAVLKALALARRHGARTALDIDYRPNLWGLAGHGAGESRFVESAAVTAKLQSTLHLFDLIVGTEEEFHIAGGSTHTVAALRAVRAVSDATLVCKRGPMGAVAFTGEIPDSLDDGETGPGFPIEVFNVLGAGDGFMSGLLKGWLDGEDWPTALKYANACGAFAVSRHGCTPAYPSWEEQSWGRLNSLISTSAKVGSAATDIAEPAKSGRGDGLPAHHVEQRALQALWRGLERARETSVGAKTVAKAKELWKAEIIELISLEEWLDTLDVVLGGMVFDMHVENLLKMSEVETVSRFDRPKAREKTVYGTSGLRPAAFAAVLIWLERLGFDTHPEAFYEPIIKRIKRASYLDENELTCFWHARERGKFKTSEHFVDAQTKISNVERIVMKGRTGLTIKVNRSTDPLGLIESLQIYRA